MFFFFCIYSFILLDYRHFLKIDDGDVLNMWSSSMVKQTIGKLISRQTLNVVLPVRNFVDVSRDLNDARIYFSLPFLFGWNF